MGSCGKCNLKVDDNVSLGCLHYGQFGHTHEVEQIKKSLSSGKCQEFRAKPKLKDKSVCDYPKGGPNPWPTCTRS